MSNDGQTWPANDVAMAVVAEEDHGKRGKLIDAFAAKRALASAALSDAAWRAELTIARAQARNDALEEAAKAVPTSWLDPMLSGPHTLVSGGVDSKAVASIERILTAVAEQIRALKVDTK